MSTDVCKRCGDLGPDLRTLSVDCFYDLTETGIPFFERKASDKDGTLYRLRFCKSCRSDFISMLSEWFFTPRNDGEGTIPVRVNGAVRMLTSEQLKAYRGDKRKKL